MCMPANTLGCIISLFSAEFNRPGSLEPLLLWLLSYDIRGLEVSDNPCRALHTESPLGSLL